MWEFAVFLYIFLSFFDGFLHTSEQNSRINLKCNRSSLVHSDTSAVGPSVTKTREQRMNVFNIWRRPSGVSHLLLAIAAMLVLRGHFVGSASHTALSGWSNDSQHGALIHQRPLLHLCHQPVMDNNGRMAHASETS